MDGERMGWPRVKAEAVWASTVSGKGEGRARRRKEKEQFGGSGELGVGGVKGEREG